MTGENWYYCNVEGDDEKSFGPVPLEHLARLIRGGALPYDVLVSTTGLEWEEADTVEQVLDTIPLDRERLMQENSGYGEAPPGEEIWGWASDRMYALSKTYFPKMAQTLTFEWNGERSRVKSSGERLACCSTWA